MTPRPSLRSVGTTLAAAAVLVVGANLASYAATGNALILGHANKAGGTTSLKNTGRGPALSLNSIKSAPPLVVNSKKMVKNLNANMVGGQSASQLAGKVIRFHIGSVGATFPGNTAKLFFAKVPRGNYQIGISGIVSDVGGSGDSYTCLVADKNALLIALGGGTLDLNKVYAVDESTQDDFMFGFMNYTNPTQKVANANIALGCAFNGTGTYTENRLVSFTFRPISVGDKKTGGAVPLPRSAAQRLSNALR
jgi:hypothetical protein